MALRSSDSPPVLASLGPPRRLACNRAGRLTLYKRVISSIKNMALRGGGSHFSEWGFTIQKEVDRRATDAG